MAGSGEGVNPAAMPLVRVRPGGPIEESLLARSAVDVNELGHFGVDLGTPAAAVEDAVMTDLGLKVMMPLADGHARTEIQNRGGLADRADIVVLALHREDRGTRDGARLDLAAPRLEVPERQGMLLKDALDGL